MKKGAEDYLRIEEISPSMLGKALLYAIERKRHEHDLRTQKEFYENLLREANVWVEALDRQGNVILWNRITSYNVCYTKLLRWKEAGGAVTTEISVADPMVFHAELQPGMRASMQDVRERTSFV